MQARIIVHYAGQEYYGNWGKVDDISLVADSFQDLVQDGHSFQLPLEGGSYIIFGEVALKTCVMLIETLKDA